MPYSYKGYHIHSTSRYMWRVVDWRTCNDVFNKEFKTIKIAKKSINELKRGTRMHNQHEIQMIVPRNLPGGFDGVGPIECGAGQDGCDARVYCVNDPARKCVCCEGCEGAEAGHAAEH